MYWLLLWGLLVIGIIWYFPWLLKAVFRTVQLDFKGKHCDGKLTAKPTQRNVCKIVHLLTCQAEDGSVVWSRWQIQAAARPVKTQGKAQPPRHLYKAYQNWTSPRKTNAFWVRAVNTLTQLLSLVRTLVTMIAKWQTKQKKILRPPKSTYLAVRQFPCSEENSCVCAVFFAAMLIHLSRCSVLTQKLGTK